MISTFLHKTPAGVPTILLLLLAAQSVQAAPAIAVNTPLQVTQGSFGFDVTGMDRSVRPGDDFNAYANGAWLAHSSIPADHSSFGVFNQLADLSRERTREILEAAQSQPGSKIGDLYASFMDEGSAERLALAPLRLQLDAIARATDKGTLIAVLASLQRQGTDGLIDVEVAPDDRAPGSAVVRLHQDGLGLQDRQYYLTFNAQMDAARAAYENYAALLLSSVGVDSAAAVGRAKSILAFETALAAVHWSGAEKQDVEKTYNLWPTRQFSIVAPGIDWDAYLTGLGIRQQSALLVNEPSALVGEARLWKSTALPILQDWVRVRLLDHYAPYLNRELVDAHFEFHGKALAGVPEQRPRWQRGVNLVTRAMGEALGKEYVARYFPPESKAAVEQIVANLTAAYRQRLAAATWMSPGTRAKALEKLSTFKAQIGYPARWRDYAGLPIVRDDLVGNVTRASAFEYQRKLDNLRQPVDRDEWLFAPMSVNGWANRRLNEAFFPAAILQAPLFDRTADSAINYGGIGAVIGHEISHLFDDQGRKYDAAGTLNNWWSTQDATRFEELTARLVRQYDAYAPLPGVHANGTLTLSENLADLGGLEASYQAYQIALSNHPAPVLEGYSGSQRFFLGNAQISRTLYRPEALRNALLTDPHAPDALRIATVRNMDGWYEAFGVAPGDRMYLAPAMRVHIW